MRYVLMMGGLDGHGPQVSYQTVPAADALLWYRECDRQRVGDDEVCPIDSVFTLMRYTNECSSVVLWISQNIEDDYTYNLAL